MALLPRVHGELEGDEFRDPQSLLAAFAAHGDSAVTRLVSCIDRMDRTNATANGKPAPLGYVCLTALTYVAYHEEEDEQGDLEAWGGGHIAVLPDSASLARAKAAWEKVLREKSYTLT